MIKDLITDKKRVGCGKEWTKTSEISKKAFIFICCDSKSKEWLCPECKLKEQKQ